MNTIDLLLIIYGLILINKSMMNTISHSYDLCLLCLCVICVYYKFYVESTQIKSPNQDPKKSKINFYFNVDIL